MKNYEEVPLTPEADINPNATTWQNGKCVKLDEGRFVTYYAQHRQEERTQIQPSQEGEEEVKVTVCKAVAVRIAKGKGSLDLRRLCDDESVFNEILPLYVSDNFEEFKGEVLNAINAYDKSDAVNHFSYKGNVLWLSREDRIVIKDRFEREKNAGKLTTHLFYKGQDITVSPEQGIALINEVSSYADQCFDATQTHLQKVKDIQDVDVLIHYDYTQGYPPALNL